MVEVSLSHSGLPGGRLARLGPLTGAIEESVDAEDCAAFGRIVDRLLQPCSNNPIGPGGALDIAVTDLDRMALVLYRHHFGNYIESRVICVSCDQPFEVKVDLSRFSLERPSGAVNGVGGPDANGQFRMDSGQSFRLPTLRDQLAVSDLDGETARQVLIQRCCDRSDLDPEAANALEAAMEVVGPLGAGQISAPCPHCGTTKTEASFSIQQAFLEALGLERRFLDLEVHYLARVYNWSRAEILAMPTDDRRIHVRMILAEAARG